ncbi:hypothetical protein SCHPADRAFT_78609 [Schizopora paradoxa]|uniref:DUF6534 domain-containing protein n=1 Tax=Schizopora paradoxa TaxID=27342 RepID=A0A0H2S4Q7_9AGAM|nr:hypothetical protein SCHPADRAFT_78609 [Schizopora paradoxa]
MSNVTVTLPSNLAPTAAPLLLGYLFNWGLYGVLSCQVYIYYVAFPSDKRLSKCLVYGIYLIETIQTILITHEAFDEYAKGFGNLDALDAQGLKPIAVPIFTGIVSCTVQMYYGRRLAIVSGSRLLGLTVAVVALIQGSAAITQGVQAYLLKQFSVLATKAFVSCTIWLAGSALCDVIIAVCMTYVLLDTRSGIPTTRALISRVVRLVIETGCLTALAAIVDLTLFLVLPGRSYHGTVALVLAKLYSNSLLVIFNNRIHLSFEMRDYGSTTPTTSNIIFVEPTEFRHSTTITSVGGLEYDLSTIKSHFRVDTSKRLSDIEEL